MKKNYQMPDAVLCMLDEKDIVATSSLEKYIGDPTWGEDEVFFGSDFQIK